MLKSKKALYILIPLVLLIWGAVIYRIVTGLGSDEINPVFNTQPDMQMSVVKANDTFSLIAAYRDPFLGSIATEKKPVVKKAAEKPKTVTPVVSTPWPTLTYSGMIRNQQKDKMLALVTINGQSYMMTKGEAKDGVQLLSADRDSAVVVFNKEKKVVRKI